MGVATAYRGRASPARWPSPVHGGGHCVQGVGKSSNKVAQSRAWGRPLRIGGGQVDPVRQLGPWTCRLGDHCVVSKSSWAGPRAHAGVTTAYRAGKSSQVTVLVIDPCKSLVSWQ